VIPKVYVIHEPVRRDKQTGQMIPVFDLQPASRFGVLTFVLPGGNRPPLSPEAVLPQIRDAMMAYTEDDYIVTVGDPALYVWAAALAAHGTNGAVNLLKWNAREQSYYAAKAQLW